MTGPAINLPTRTINLIVFVILASYPLVGMGIDLIAPSLPAISHDLNASSNISKNLISIYLLGYALGNFFLGFLSDALGRRRLLLTGMFAFVIASLLPVLFPNIPTLFFARLLQGLALGSLGVIGRAILSDILPHERLLRVATMVATMWGIGPVIGPVIGGYLQYYFDWQACFYFFAGFGLLSFLLILITTPETHLSRHPLNITHIKNNFMSIATHRLFVGLIILMGFTYSLLIVFNTLGPFLIQTGLGYSPVYFGHVALCMGIAFLAGTFICRRLLRTYTPEDLFKVMIPLSLLIALAAIGAALIHGKNIWVVIFPSIFMFLACGIMYPAAMAKGMGLFRHIAGSASAVMTVTNVLITTITAVVMSFLNVTTALPIALIYVAIILLCAVDYWLGIKE